MNSVHLMVLSIVALALCYCAYEARLKYRAREARASRERSDSDDAEAMRAQIDELEERIRVLEQIVTDPKEDLSRKIANL